MEVSEVLEILQKARAVITPPEKWCRHSRASAGRDGIVAHCALGAIDVAINGYSMYGINEHPAIAALSATLTADEVAQARAAMSKHAYYGMGEFDRGDHSWRTAWFNNSTDHKTVLAWFDRAIESQKIIDGLKIAPKTEAEVTKELVTA